MIARVNWDIVVCAECPDHAISEPFNCCFGASHIYKRGLWWRFRLFIHSFNSGFFKWPK